MDNLRGAFDGLLFQVENEDEKGLQEVIQKGYVSQNGAAAMGGKPLRSSVPSAGTPSPAFQRQQSELANECARLREQLSLSQQQLAKAAGALAAKQKDGDKFTLRGNNKRNSGAAPAARGWGKGKSKKDEKDEAASRRTSDAEENFSSELLQTTMNQLETERTRAAAAEAEVAKLKEAAEKKIEERLNEMARRLNRANQANEEKYKAMYNEVADMKNQVLSARKACLRKVQDLEQTMKERQRESDQKLLKAVGFAQELRTEVAQGRAAVAENNKMKRELTLNKQLVDRSVTAIGGLKEGVLKVNSENEELKVATSTMEKEVARLKEHVQSLIKEKNELSAKMVESEESLTATKTLEIQELEKKHQEEMEAMKKKHEEEMAALKVKNDALMQKVEATLAQHPRLNRQATNVEEKDYKEKRRGSGLLTSIGTSIGGKEKEKEKDKPDVEPISFLSLIQEGGRSRSPSLAEALGEAPPPIKRVSSSSAASLEMGSDETWKTWITEPYVYDKWDSIQNVESDREGGPLVLPIKGHNLEVGSTSAAPIGDSIHLEFVEPLERVVYYQKFLRPRDHVHFVGASTSGEHMVVTVEAANDFNRAIPLMSLVHMKKATTRCVLDMEKCYPLPSSMVELDPYLVKTYPGCNLKRVDDASVHDLLSQRLVEFEDMHVDFKRRVGILYWKSGQNENEAFGNNMSPGLDEFLNFFGERIKLKGWTKFRGGMNVKNDETGEYAVYTEYKNFEFMAHVSALLPFRENDEQKLDRKRHIGNDLVVVIFWEGPGSFDASKLVTQMCHVFIVIERVPSVEGSDVPRYRVGVICRSGVQPFKPYLPAPAVFDADEKFRDWLMMKIINGERATFQARTFVSKTSTARKVLLEKMAREVIPLLVDPPSLSAPFQCSRLVFKEPMTRVKAISAFQGVAPSHLSFKKGEEIVLYSRPSAEWWNGGAGVKRGDFPASKVVVVEKKEKRKWGKARTGTAAKEVVEAGPSTPEAEEAPDASATHEVTYKIVKASNLTGKGANGSSDPMVKCCIISINGELEGSKRQTQKVKQNLSPEWNETFTIKILDPLWEVLRIEVIDAENDKFMGQTEVACGELLGQCGSDPWEVTLEPPLDPKALDTLVSGSVTLAVTNVVDLQAGKGGSGNVPKMGSLGGDSTSP